MVNMDLTTTDSGLTLVLPDVVDAYLLAELKDILVQALADDKAITIDGTQVTKIDGLGCQLLAAARKTCDEQEKGFVTPSF